MSPTPPGGKPTINRTGRDADARTTCNECRCRSDYFIRASRNFFALKSFFSRISQGCNGQAAWQNQGK
jgi:hypothetical protein